MPLPYSACIHELYDKPQFGRGVGDAASCKIKKEKFMKNSIDKCGPSIYDNGAVS